MHDPPDRVQEKSPASGGAGENKELIIYDAKPRLLTRYIQPGANLGATQDVMLRDHATPMPFCSSKPPSQKTQPGRIADSVASDHSAPSGSKVTFLGASKCTDFRVQLRAIELAVQPDPYPHHFHLADVIFFKGLKTERAPRLFDVRTREWTYLREPFIHISTPRQA